MNTKIIKCSFYGIAAVLTGILAFFIIYNAGWIIGDDAMVIRVTGWGHFFNLADMVLPYSGRFYPLAYMAYNILPILGLTSVNAHFTLLAVTFIMFVCFSIWIIIKAIETDQLTWQDYVLVLSAVMVCISRVYSNFLDAYSTAWVAYTMVILWALCCYYIHEYQSLTAMTIGLASVSYLTYCGETNFVLPLVYGISGLIFTWKISTKLEKAYYWSLVGVALIFLLLYFFICFIHIEDAYDGSHGTNVTILGNAIKMFVAQKVLWVVLILVCWRAYCLIVKKEEFEFWDAMLLSGCAYCCGCAVMKLNWVLYYSLASLFMVPAVVHYLHKCLGSKWAWIIMLALGLFTFRNVPNYIKNNQRARKGTAATMAVLTSEYKTGNSLYWYAPEDDREWCVDLDHRAWLYSCIETHLAWEMDDEFYKLPELKTFDNLPGVYLLPSDNNKLFPGINETVISAGEMLQDGGGMKIVKIQ